MPGPPRKHPDKRRRRNAAPELTVLPAEGRKGKAPAWPLGRMVAGELAAWREAWATPQAAQWERLGGGHRRVVARYVRCQVAAEEVDAPASLRAEVRQLEDRLGLSPMSMRRLQWTIAPDEVGQARADRDAAGDAPATSPRRLRAVDG